MRRVIIRIGALAAKEALHIRRDRRVLYMALVMPAALLVLFGYGVSFDIDRIPLAIIDHDHSAQSRSLTQTFGSNREFKLVESVQDPASIDELFRRGRALVVLVIPRNFAKQLSRGETTAVQLIIDGSDAFSANQTLAKAEAMGQGLNLKLSSERGIAALPPLVVRSWLRFNPEGKSALYLVPGLTAYILAIVAVLLTSLTVAREWERGSMEQLFTTPVGRLEIVLGKLLPYWALGSLAVLLVLTVGAWVFDVPLRGSLSFLALSSLLFLIGALGQGLLISVVTRNQVVATQVAVLSSMLPAMLLSGALFPISNMPKPLQLVSALVPARYYVASLRGVLLRGNGFQVLWPQSLALLAFASVMVALSAARFKRQLS